MIYLYDGNLFDISAAHNDIVLNGQAVSTPAGFFLEATNRAQLGDALTTAPDPDPNYYHVVDVNGIKNWVAFTADELAANFAAMKSNRIQQLSADCAASIYSGFTSSALGADYHYPALDKDQSNLAASVLESVLPYVDQATWATPFMCSDSAGVWQHRMHTAAQIQQVGKDAKAAIVAAVLKNAQLAATVNAITSTGVVSDDIAAVCSIVW